MHCMGMEKDGVVAFMKLLAFRSPVIDGCGVQLASSLQNCFVLWYYWTLSSVMIVS